MARDCKNEVLRYKRIFKLLKNYNNPSSLMEVIYLLNPKIHEVI